MSRDQLLMGSLCSGYRGLDMAIEEVFGATTAWVSDIDPGANKILAHHWPTTPNIGDLTTADWHQVLDAFGRPRIVCGGYPCQPFSLAGELKGTEDERHIWPHIARALRVLRPRYAIFENVANHLRLGFDTVLCDLADLGFDVEWCVVRADEVGAPHQRRRLIFLATAADAPYLGHERGGRARGGRPGSTDGRVSAADAERLGRQGERINSGSGAGRTAATPIGCGPAGSSELAAEAASLGRGEGRPEPARQQGRLGVAVDCGSATPDADSRGLTGDTERDLWPHEPGQRAPHGDDAQRPGVQRRVAADTDCGRWGPDEHDVQQGQPDADWGRFAPAVRRWEAVTGRRAPRATDDRRRLSPEFVEWMMGLPAGHVTAVPGLTRTRQLKALGNGVVPQQAAAAIRLLAERAGIWTEAAA